MASLTYRYRYKNYDITIVGYEVPGGWRMAIEIRRGDSAQVIRDTEHLYRDFNSLRSIGVLNAHLAIHSRSDHVD
ncbi:hypothetical protein PMI40_01329 [Herbaspirillum sp. YR522]|nr:hypothetical protein PMI40_01329 [Herbaspirillum sp. YR522]